MPNPVNISNQVETTSPNTESTNATLVKNTVDTQLNGTSPSSQNYTPSSLESSDYSSIAQAQQQSNYFISQTDKPPVGSSFSDYSSFSQNPVITADVEVSALGDLLYGYIMLFVSGITIQKFLLFNLFSICGGIVVVCVAVLLGSLSFWIGNSDMIADMGNSLATNFATYPDGIFKGAARVVILTLIPVGVTSYIPIWVMTKFDLGLTMIVIGATVTLTLLAFFVFNRGLRRYSSSNLMGSKI